MALKDKMIPADVEKINSPVMVFSPTTESALIFLFGSKAKEMGFVIKKFNSSGIDCNAMQRTPRGWKECRIEFELYSHDFKTHGHKRSQCDIIISWEDTILRKSGFPEVIELRPYFTKTCQIWMMAYDEKYYWSLEHYKRATWSIPKGSHKGDLLIMYCKSPKSRITHLLTMTSNVQPDKKWKWQAKTKRVTALQEEKQIKFAELKASPNLKDAHFIKRKMQGRFNVTPYWPQILKMILGKNIGLKRKLNPWLS
jgi:hypothetical protein